VKHVLGRDQEYATEAMSAVDTWMLFGGCPEADLPAPPLEHNTLVGQPGPNLRDQTLELCKRTDGRSHLVLYPSTYELTIHGLTPHKSPERNSLAEAMAASMDARFILDPRAIP